MIYLTNPILTTPADVLVVPCSMSGKILPGLQSAVVERYGMDYVTEFQDDIKNGLIKIGSPGIFKAEGAGEQIILHIPVAFETDIPVLLTDIMQGLREVVGFMAGSQDLRSVAVGPLGDMYSWETIEGICERLEMIYGDKGIEFMMYPGDEEDDEMEEVIQTVKVLV